MRITNKHLKVESMDIIANRSLNIYSCTILTNHFAFNITECCFFLHDVLNVKKHTVSAAVLATTLIIQHSKIKKPIAKLLVYTKMDKISCEVKKLVVLLYGLILVSYKKCVNDKFRGWMIHYKIPDNTVMNGLSYFFSLFFKIKIKKNEAFLLLSQLQSLLASLFCALATKS